MTADLDLALAADRAIRRRAALEATEVPGGLVVRHPELHDVHYLNAVLLDDGTPELDGARVTALAERWLGDLGHRHVVFDDAAAGERAARHLERHGWERGRIVLMVFAGDPAAAKPDPRARAISAAEMEALQVAAVGDQAPEVRAGGGLAARLVAAQRRLRATTCARCLGAGDPGGELASMGTLLLDPDLDGRRVATLTEVGTRVAHRERGLARAVVLAAVAEAADWGAERILVGADADDWPQLLYARLGFAPVGRQVTLTRRLRGPSRSVSSGV
ncbi:MAG TPA: GNAT family N-acetyltransferase [Solirubrobacteraceae bacterium]